MKPSITYPKLNTTKSLGPCGGLGYQRKYKGDNASQKSVKEVRMAEKYDPP